MTLKTILTRRGFHVWVSGGHGGYGNIEAGWDNTACDFGSIPRRDGKSKARKSTMGREIRGPKMIIDKHQIQKTYFWAIAASKQRTLCSTTSKLD